MAARRDAAEPNPPRTADGAAPFEARLEALEAVVKDLERDDVPLEQAIARYREGVGHLKACRELLDDAERRLVELVQEADGSASERPLRVSERGLERDTAPGAEPMPS